MWYALLTGIDYAYDAVLGLFDGDASEWVIVLREL